MSNWVNHTAATMQAGRGASTYPQRPSRSSTAATVAHPQAVQGQPLKFHNQHPHLMQQQTQGQVHGHAAQPHPHAAHHPGAAAPAVAAGAVPAPQAQIHPAQQQHQLALQQQQQQQQAQQQAQFQAQLAQQAVQQQQRYSMTNGIPLPAYRNPLPKVQGTYSTYASRIREANSALILPLALGRRAKRAVVSMAESDEDDWDFEDSPRGTPTRLQKEKEQRERMEKEKKAVLVPRPRKTRHIFHSRKTLEAVADHEAILVPIRLDIDTDEYKLRDSFTWNVNEQLMTPENFAEILCDDLDLNLAKFVPEIAASIRNQIAEFEPIAEVQVPEEGSRTVIQLDLHVGGINLRDRFEWDVGSDLTPEEFAKQLAADLGIGGEFVSMIAHEIHEQLFRFKQDRLLDRGGFDIEPLYSGFRPTDDGENWSPALETLTAEELEKIMEDRERSVRRNRRETSRYGNRRRGGASGSVMGRTYQSLSKRGARLGARGPAMDMAGYQGWRCKQCGLGAHSTVMLRSGPDGERTLCNTCGIYWRVKGTLPELRKDLFVFADDQDTEANGVAEKGGQEQQQQQQQQQQDQQQPSEYSDSEMGTEQSATPA
ncbi:Chromatin structure remodeling complex protein sfh1 [Actinomortierella wolfii]|nr:Chromatin structure remodeling complex protein sfh1 [Actinomortierella wolfii]